MEVLLVSGAVTILVVSGAVLALWKRDFFSRERRRRRNAYRHRVRKDHLDANARGPGRPPGI